MRKKRLLVVSCAGLDLGLVARSSVLGRLHVDGTKTVFPAVTCTAQATMRTGLLPCEHGVVCNGRYSHDACSVAFWGQSARVMPRKRIWDGVRSRGGRACVLFHQQSLGDSADMVLSPAPIHKHGGGMVQSCYSIPADMETLIASDLKCRFQLWRYWGPLASAKAGNWCAGGTVSAIKHYSPDLLLTYLPDMDYVLQRQGPQGRGVQHELDVFSAHCQYLLDAAKMYGYDVVFWGDYSICEVNQVVYPNRMLLEAGLFSVREVGGRTYPDLYSSRAFAMVDHQVAHIYVDNTTDIEIVRQVFSGVSGIDKVQTALEAGLEHPNSGELVLTSSSNAWFAYRWWNEERMAPDYAHHIDIHSKIGYDPCELFWKVPFFSTETDCSLVKGSHGRCDKPVAIAASDGAKELVQAASLHELAKRIEQEVSE